MEFKWNIYVCIAMLVVFIEFSHASREPIQCRKCLNDNSCKPPSCFCCREDMNLPIAKTDIPQIVFFTFDDALTGVSAKFYHQLFNESRKNPNGCPISMTMFISHQDTEYRKVNEFYRKGMEIAAHSVTHAHMTAENFLKEAKKQKQNLARLGGVPENEVVGWRSPFLEPVGDMQPSKLKELGYVYDATLTFSKRNLNDKAPTPFTLDFGWPYDCKVKPCPKRRHLGFWEVPVVSLLDYKHMYDCVYVDGCNNPPPDESSAYKFLMDNLNSYYTRSRVPFGINMHSSWFHIPDRLRAMDRFIQKLLKMDDVYIVSVDKMIKWLKDPTPLSKLNTFKPWGCTGVQSSHQTVRQGNRNEFITTPHNAGRNSISDKRAKQRAHRQFIQARLRQIAEMRKQIEINRQKQLRQMQQSSNARKNWWSKDTFSARRKWRSHSHGHNSHQSTNHATENHSHTKPTFSMNRTIQKVNPDPKHISIENNKNKDSSKNREPVKQSQPKIKSKNSDVPFWQRGSLGSRRVPETVVSAQSPWWKKPIPKVDTIRKSPIRAIKKTTTQTPLSVTVEPAPPKINVNFVQQLKDQERQRQKMIEEQKIRQEEQLRQQKLQLKRNEEIAIRRQHEAKQKTKNSQANEPTQVSKRHVVRNEGSKDERRIDPWQKFVTFLMTNPNKTNA